MASDHWTSELAELDVLRQRRIRAREVYLETSGGFMNDAGDASTYVRAYGGPILPSENSVIRNVNPQVQVAVQGSSTRFAFTLL